MTVSAEERAAILKKLTNARKGLIYRNVFFASLAQEMRIIDASSWCDTAATDGRDFFYNHDFIKSLDHQELIFLFGHEILHCVLQHIHRRGDREPAIYNMANDYLINATLIDEKVGVMPEGGLYHAKYSSLLSSNEIYDLLIASNAKQQNTLDMHLDGLVDPDTGKPLSAEEREAFATVLRDSIIRAASMSSSVPNVVKRAFSELQPHVLNWKELLDTFLRSSLKADYTFKRFSRRTWAGRKLFGAGSFILPAQDDQETVKIVVAIDASGSLSDEMLKDLISEVKGILLSFSEPKVDLFSFDTSVHSHEVFTAENLDDIDNWQPSGGGGTLFECVWNHLEAEDIVPERLVVLTDGLPNGSWGSPDYCPTLFVIHGSETITPPFGEVAYYK